MAKLSNIAGMYKIKAVAFLLLMLAALSGYSQSTGTGQWRIHLPFKSTRGIAETPRYVYTWANFGFYRYDKEVNASERLSKIQGFSDIAVSYIKYNPANDVLVIVYLDGNIDIVKDNTIINVNDLQRASINGFKNANNIVFDGNFAYLACSFGVVLLDIERLEIRASYRDLNIGDINDVALWNNTIYVATTQGIYRAPLIGANLNDPASWTQFDTGQVNFLYVFNNNLFAVRPHNVFYYDGVSWNTFINPAPYNSINATNNQLVLARKDTVVVLDNNLNPVKRAVNALKTAMMDKNGNIWYTTDNNGTLRISTGGELLFTMPVGPYSEEMGHMAALDDEVYVAGGSVAGNLTLTYSLNGFYKHKDDKWENSLDVSNPALDTLRDFWAVTTNPKTKEVWMGAYWQGLVRMRDGQVLDIFTPRNSTLKLNPINFIGGLAIDNNNHLWISNYGADSALVVRTAQGQWASLSLGNLKQISQIAVDNNNRKWILTPRAGIGGAPGNVGLIVYDDNKTPLNPNDDLGPKYLNSTAGQGGLPDNVVNCVARDRDGEIWVGTLKGPAVFSNPGNIFSSNPSDARQIVIGEGTDIGYLLGNEVVNDIFIDGGNRKWFGTNNGAWLVSPDGQKILAHFNMDNSPIFSNVVNQIVVNEATGEVFFGTDRGIISYKGDATVAEKTHGDVLVYPNPVREDFEGVISIRGLAQDANVKITDIAGNLIYETVANGGMATWDGRSFSGRKASTGVYLIFSGTDDASDTYVAKVLVVNGK